MTPNWSFETRQIHAGQTPDPTTKARALPIYQTTSYAFDSSEHGRKLFALEELGNIYTRIMNPTQAVVEDRINSLEGGVGALLVASGQSAETLAILTLAEAGDQIVSSPRLYGGTYNLFHYTLPKMGITVDFVEDPDDPESWRAAAKPNTKAFYAESISNPCPRRARFRDGCGGRARGGRAADRRQHRAHPVSHPADRARRGHRGALGHQVPGRPRHRDRRRHRRLRQLRLGRQRRPVPELQHPRPQLQQPHLGRGPRTGGPVQGQCRLHLQGPAAGAAGHRAGDQPVQRLPHLPGHRDAVAAGTAAQRQRRPGRRLPGRPGRGRVGVLPGPGLQPLASPAAEVLADRRRARSSASRSRAASRPVRRSPTRSSCSPTWRTSGTCGRW